jgi:transposase
VGQHVDLVRSSLPASQQLILEAVEETADGIVFRVRGMHTPRCQSCFESRVSYHSRYMRRMRDLPWQGKRVEIHLQARRFRCRNNACDRKIFAERLPDLAGPKARETTDPKAHQLRRFVLQFRAMLRWRNANKLCTWIEAASASHFRFLAQFANTLRRDLKAVELSITTPWSNGPIEGHINRLKAIKRQMYGRAGFELLKARVLPWDVPQAA